MGTMLQYGSTVSKEFVVKDEKISKWVTKTEETEYKMGKHLPPH